MDGTGVSVGGIVGAAVAGGVSVGGIVGAAVAGGVSAGEGAASTAGAAVGPTVGIKLAVGADGANDVGSFSAQLTSARNPPSSQAIRHMQAITRSGRRRAPGQACRWSLIHAPLLTFTGLGMRLII